MRERDASPPLRAVAVRGDCTGDIPIVGRLVVEIR
jgi:hypothetical protein